MYIVRNFVEKTRVCLEFGEVPDGITNAKIQEKLHNQVYRKFSSSQSYVLSHPVMIARSEIYYSMENIYGQYVIDVVYKADVLFIQVGSIIYGAKITTSMGRLGLVCKSCISNRPEYSDVSASIFVPQLYSTTLFEIEDLGSLYSNHRYINVYITRANDNINKDKLELVANPHFFDSTSIQKSITFKQDPSEISNVFVSAIRKVMSNSMVEKFVEDVVIDIREQLEKISNLSENELKTSIELANVLSIFEKKYKKIYIKKTMSKYNTKKMHTIYEEQTILTYDKFEELSLDTEKKLIEMLTFGESNVVVLQTPPLTYLAIELFYMIASVCKSVTLRRLKYASPMSLTCIIIVEPKISEAIHLPLKKDDAIKIIKMTESSYESLAAANINTFKDQLIDNYLNFLKHVNSLQLIFKDGIGTTMQDPLYDKYIVEKLEIIKELNKKFEQYSHM